jgi:hypothetical protein
MLLVSSSTPPLSGNPPLIWPEILEVPLEIWTQVAVSQAFYSRFSAIL